MPTTKTTITITDLQDAAGNLLGNAWLTVRLNAGPNGGVVDGAVIATPAKVQTDADGDASIQLYPNSAITPADSYYTISVDESSPLIYRTIEVPSGGGTYDWSADAIQVEAVPFDGPYPGGTTGSAGQVVARKSSGNGFELVNHNSIAGRSTADAHPMAAVSATGLTVPKASTIVAEWEATAPAFGASSERIAAMSAVLPYVVTRDGSTAAAAAQDQHALGLLALAEAEGARTDLAELASAPGDSAPSIIFPVPWRSGGEAICNYVNGTNSVSAIGGATIPGRRWWAVSWIPARDDPYTNLGVQLYTSGIATWSLGVYSTHALDPYLPETKLVETEPLDLSVTPGLISGNISLLINTPGWYVFCMGVYSYTSNPSIINFDAAAARVSLPGWPMQRLSYNRGYVGYTDYLDSGLVIPLPETAPPWTGLNNTGLTYAGVVPRFYLW